MRAAQAQPQDDADYELEEGDFMTARNFAGTQGAREGPFGGPSAGGRSSQQFAGVGGMRFTQGGQGQAQPWSEHREFTATGPRPANRASRLPPMFGSASNRSFGASQTPWQPQIGQQGPSQGRENGLDTGFGQANNFQNGWVIGEPSITASFSDWWTSTFQPSASMDSRL